MELVLPRPMRSYLLAWVGLTDLRAAGGDSSAGVGPIGQAVIARQFDEIVLLSDHSKSNTKTYAQWLATKTGSQISVRAVELSGPTEFGEIYLAAASAVEDIVKTTGPDAQLTYHLSPGTPPMAAVWIILAKTRFPAELIESSVKGGVRTASVPFDMSADFIPDLLRKSDEELTRLMQGLPPEAPEFGDIVHRCVAMKRVIALARRFAPHNVSVLILGESGTGKEMLARAIHRASPRREGPFIAVNCGAIPQEIAEAELFGYEKGAFTGATKSKAGHIEEASGGTLFLDEIGELPLPQQVKLLRVLQDLSVTRVGSSKPRSVDVRVIAATNRNLIDDMTSGRFREDLFHRIAVCILTLPPLREREGDLSLLLDHLLEQVNEKFAADLGFQQKKLSIGARSLLIRHAWPGNVRELLNTLQRASLRSAGEAIEISDIRESLLPSGSGQRQEILGRALGNGFKIEQLLADVAKHYLARAVEEAHGNKTIAAELVGLPSYQTLTNWLRRYAINNPLARRLPKMGAKR